jgi:hypothetical protein
MAVKASGPGIQEYHLAVVHLDRIGPDVAILPLPGIGLPDGVQKRTGERDPSPVFPLSIRSSSSNPVFSTS